MDAGFTRVTLPANLTKIQCLMDNMIPKPTTSNLLERGLKCHDCGGKRFKVIYTRSGPGVIKRRRECRGCGRRLTTWERVVP